MLLAILFLGAGVGFLIYGARLLVDGAASLARRFGVSLLVIGLTVVAFGTSAPELIVNIFASLKGSADIAIGNVLGSNLANIFLMLGIAAMIYPLRVQLSTVWKEIPMSLLAVIAVGVMANDILFDRARATVISRSEGIILLFFFIIFLYYTYGISKVEGEGAPVKIFNPRRSVVMVAGGLLMLFLGGKFMVDGAIAVARIWGVSEALIGFTIVAVGTSLPELAASAMAAYKRQADIAVGNIVGSNIFNIFFILGTSATIRAIPFSTILNVDLLFVVFATVLLFLAFFIGKRHILERWQGAGFVGIYIIYLIYAIVRG
ncbi:MAG: Na+/Ca+ antiporter, CaCA family [Parcubacteria group bacterium GW2011_GWC2_45_7]|nr:MAG: Na+/Ca+ antiporter, CaCA family [Parcubacteria group bacterium GW2011_GWC2_45_7]KKU73161.1 MAG: Na+/Ca+ antiporter, CaCA family [Parcubacteria group bacterium GW2011_GWA2_47_26]